MIIKSLKSCLYSKCANFPVSYSTRFFLYKNFHLKYFHVWSVFFSGHLSFSMGFGSSNLRCQDICRDKGYILAATKSQQCHCGNVYPKGIKRFFFELHRNLT